MDAWELLDQLDELRRQIPRDADDGEARTVRYHLDRATYAARRAYDRERAANRAAAALPLDTELPALPARLVRVTA